MAFNFLRSASVAIGSFNIYIIQPKWLGSKGFVKEGTDLTIETTLDEPGLRISANGYPFRWVVTPSKIAIETKDEAADCGKVMASLLRYLPETPLTAVANHTVYSSPTDKTVPQPPAFPCVAPMEGYDVTESAYLIAVRSPSDSYNLLIQYNATGQAELLVSSYCPIRSDEGSRLAASHVERFQEHKRTGLVLAKHHFEGLQCSTHS
jgi:hypothetical protein